MTISFSFRSMNYPKRFIRHRNFLGELSEVDFDLSNDTDKRDASFVIEPGLIDPLLISMRATNPEFPNYYLRHQAFRLRLDQRPSGGTETQLFDADATFSLTVTDSPEDWLPGQQLPCILRAYNFPNYCIRHKNFELWLEEGLQNSQPYARDRSFFIVVGFVAV